MLTKELLCFRISKEKIYPIFIDPEEKKNSEITRELLNVFARSIGDIREKLEENTTNILERFRGNYKVAKGLEKLLYDRTEFDSAPKEDLIKFREKVFHCSSKFLGSKINVNSKK